MFATLLMPVVKTTAGLDMDRSPDPAFSTGSHRRRMLLVGPPTDASVSLRVGILDSPFQAIAEIRSQIAERVHVGQVGFLAIRHCRSLGHRLHESMRVEK
jgi:hypothetical protein